MFFVFVVIASFSGETKNKCYCSYTQGLDVSEESLLMSGCHEMYGIYGSFYYITNILVFSLEMEVVKVID